MSSPTKQKRTRGNYLGMALIAAAVVLGASSWFDFGNDERQDTIVVGTDTIHGAIPDTIPVCSDLPQNDPRTRIIDQSPRVVHAGCYSSRETMDRDGKLNHPWRLLVAVLLGLAGFSLVTAWRPWKNGKNGTATTKPATPPRPAEPYSSSPESARPRWNCTHCNTLNPASSTTCISCGRSRF